MLEIFIAGPDLSLLDDFDALGEGFQGTVSVDDTPRAARKRCRMRIGWDAGNSNDKIAGDFRAFSTGTFVSSAITGCPRSLTSNLRRLLASKQWTPSPSACGGGPHQFISF
jgi:hypothetical protein